MKLNTNAVLWVLAFGAYALFLAWLSWLYPWSSDEFLDFSPSLSSYFDAYLNITPRAGSLLAIAARGPGARAFVFLNPLVQSAAAVLIFRLVFQRFPDFKTTPDLPPFLLICFLCVFAVSMPNQTLFWVNGACHYSWLMAAFMFFLVVLSALYEGKALFKDGRRARVLMFFFGAFIGMLNENLAPVGFGAALLFALLFILQKRKLPVWFYFMFCGLCAGLALMAASPAYKSRLALTPIMAAAAASPIRVKIFINLAYINRAMAANLALAPLSALILALAAADKFKAIIKLREFWLGLFFLFSGFLAAAALFYVPFAPARAFYPPTAFWVIGFLFTLKTFGRLYNFKAFKYAFYLSVFAFVLWAHAFVAPYISLYAQSARRAEIIKTAFKTPARPVYLPAYYVLQGPSENLTILFNDAALDRQTLSTYYKLDIKKGFAFEGKRPRLVRNETPVV
ncbi:MAG: DUF6056 family protein [Elusimicrobiota bacterium]|jgi:hypothetical protein|nr:DUF6056 family protein [Elusimicrobiota bacterium]